MMTYMLVAVVILLLKLNFVNCDLAVVRIRLPDGQVVRVDVKKGSDTIEQCLAQWSSEGKIPLDQVPLEHFALDIRGKVYKTKSDITLESLSLRNGEIFTLVPPSIAPKPILDKVGSTSAVKSSFIRRATKQTSNAKRVASMASLQAKKNSLEKITRQKSNLGSAVYVMPATARVLNRLSKGGYGLLLGRREQYTSDSKPKSANKPSHGVITVDKTLTSAPKIRNVTVVYAVCEVFNSDDNSFTHQINSPDTLTCVQQVDALSTDLNLDVVGCCVGCGPINPPSKSNKNIKDAKAGGSVGDISRDTASWRPNHVYGGAYLQRSLRRNTSKNGAPYLILDLSEASSTVRKEMKKGPRSKHTSTQLGLSVEAYMLSEQADRLVRDGIVVIPDGSAGSGLSEASGSEKNSLAMRNRVRKLETESDEMDTSSLLHLTSEVLVKGEECRFVDPLLLAVPVPILPKIPKFLLSLRESYSTSLPNFGTFQHSYPSAVERKLPETALLESKHISLLLSKMEKPEWDGPLRNRLCDIHLLLRLAELLGKDAVGDIAKFLIQNKAMRPSATICMSVQMARQILGHTSQEVDIE